MPVSAVSLISPPSWCLALLYDAVSGEHANGGIAVPDVMAMACFINANPHRMIVSSWLFECKSIILFSMLFKKFSLNDAVSESDGVYLRNLSFRWCLCKCFFFEREPKRVVGLFSNHFNCILQPCFI